MAIMHVVRIGDIQEGDKPQMGPDHSCPLLIEVSNGDFIQITRAAARELVGRLDAYLREAE